MSRVIDLSGKTAVVTGATGGVGRGIVRRLAEAGANVAIAYQRSADFAKELCKEVTDKYGVKAMIVQCDVTDEKSIFAMKDAIAAEIGEVDICVANAMVRHEWKLIMDQDMDTYVEQFKGFTGHAVAMAHAFIPHMREQKWGRFIAINSECAIQLFPYQSAYAANKRSLDGFCKILAKEVGPDNITVNEIGPGWVYTDLSHEDKPDDPNYCQDFPYIPQVPLRKRCTDLDVGDAVVFFASDMADSLTGVFLPVNGGNCMVSI